MAYPYYQNPYQFYPQAYQPPVLQPPQTVPASVPQNSIIWVSGEREAQMYPVAPNNAVTLWSQTESVVYVKQADATGKPTMKVYDLVERNGAACMADNATDEVAKKTDIESVKAAIASITADLETVKGDLYGMAGRKKAKRNDDDE